MRSTSVILHDIEHFQPLEDDWLALEDLLQELWAEEYPAEALVPLFYLLERFPEDESSGVLWGVLHALEDYPNYEVELVHSLRRQPTELTLTMLQRIANTGQLQVAGQPINNLYQVVLAHPTASEEVKETAQDYLTDSK